MRRRPARGAGRFKDCSKLLGMVHFLQFRSNLLQGTYCLAQPSSVDQEDGNLHGGWLLRFWWKIWTARNDIMFRDKPYQFLELLSSLRSDIYAALMATKSLPYNRLCSFYSCYLWLVLGLL